MPAAPANRVLPAEVRQLPLALLGLVAPFFVCLFVVPARTSGRTDGPGADAGRSAVLVG
jgi:hypothetical protein